MVGIKDVNDAESYKAIIKATLKDASALAGALCAAEVITEDRGDDELKAMFKELNEALSVIRGKLYNTMEFYL